MVVSTERRCANSTCRRLLASTSRPDRKFCSSSCRVTAHQRRRRSDENRAVPLSAELERALEKATEETRLVAIVAAAAPKNWRAAAWLLERKFPSRWTVRRPAAEPEPVPVADEFFEVDQIAAQRRKRSRRPVTS
jgi:hypothetical protein